MTAGASNFQNLVWYSIVVAEKQNLIKKNLNLVHQSESCFQFENGREVENDLKKQTNKQQTNLGVLDLKEIQVNL